MLKYLDEGQVLNLCGRMIKWGSGVGGGRGLSQLVPTVSGIPHGRRFGLTAKTPDTAEETNRGFLSVNPSQLSCLHSDFDVLFG